jgi:hypothetical protein
LISVLKTYNSRETVIFIYSNKMAKGNTVEVEVKKAPVKKATTGTEVILGKSALKLETGLVAVLAAVTELKQLQETSGDLTLKIAQQEADLEGLKASFNEQLRTGQVELANALKEDAKALVREVLAENGLEAVDSEELKALKKAYDTLKSEFNAQVSKDVAAAVRAATANFDADKKLYIAEQSSKEADNKAKVSNLEDKVLFLTEQNDALLGQLKEAGDNAVKIAQAGSIQTINLGAEGKR